MLPTPSPSPSPVIFQTKPLTSSSAEWHVRQLSLWLAGHFNNFDQAIAWPSRFANIHVYQCPLPWSVFGGYGFYVEQAYDITPHQPYRQRVLHLTAMNSGQSNVVDPAGGESDLTPDTPIITIQNFALKDPAAFLGAGRDLVRLATMTFEDLEDLPGCLTTVAWTGESYYGQSVPGKTCRIMRKGQETYLRSEFTVKPGLFQSLDQGLHPETDKVVWGSLSGSFEFVKAEDFAEFVPQPVAR